MSVAFSIRDAEKKIAELDIANTVKYFVQKSHWGSLRELSSTISGNANYISQQIRHKNINVPLLYTLSLYLDVNLFEYFILLLPEHKRSTGKQKELEADIARLQKELEEVKKERDIYREIALSSR